MSHLHELIRAACPLWMQLPDPALSVVDQLQSVIEQVLPGRMGIKITALEPGKITGSIVCGKDVANVRGFLHGGAIFTLGDTLAGALLWAQNDGTYVAVTSRSEIQYLRGIESGIATCVVIVEKEEGRQIFLKAEFRKDNGKRAAVMHVEYTKIPIPAVR